MLYLVSITKNKHKAADLNAVSNIESAVENFKEANKDGNDLERIMRALELTPLKEISSVKDLGKSLRMIIKSDEEAAGKGLNILLR